MTLQNDGFPLPDIIWSDHFEMETPFSRAELVERLSQHPIRSKSRFYAEINEDQSQFTVNTRTPYLRGKLKAVMLDRDSHLTIKGIVGVESGSISFMIATFFIVAPLVFMSNIIVGFIVAGLLSGVILFGYRLYAEELKQNLLAFMTLMCAKPVGLE